MFRPSSQSDIYHQKKYLATILATLFPNYDPGVLIKMRDEAFQEIANLQNDEDLVRFLGIRPDNMHRRISLLAFYWVFDVHVLVLRIPDPNTEPAKFQFLTRVLSGLQLLVNKLGSNLRVFCPGHDESGSHPLERDYSVSHREASNRQLAYVLSDVPPQDHKLFEDADQKSIPVVVGDLDAHRSSVGPGLSESNCQWENFIQRHRHISLVSIIHSPSAADVQPDAQIRENAHCIGVLVGFVNDIIQFTKQTADLNFD